MSTLPLTSRLEPLQDALAALTREYHLRANADNQPDSWAAWSDLSAALMAIRAAQGRAARAERYPTNPGGIPHD